MRLKMFKMDMVMMKMECLMLLISLMIMKMTIIYRKQALILMDIIQMMVFKTIKLIRLITKISKKNNMHQSRSHLKLKSHQLIMKKNYKVINK